MSTPVPVRPFDIPSVQRSIDAALATIPAGKTGAVIAHADREQAGLAVFARVGDHWSFVGRLSKPYRGPLQSEAEVRFTF